MKILKNGGLEAKAMEEGREGEEKERDLGFLHPFSLSSQTAFVASGNEAQ